MYAVQHAALSHLLDSFSPHCTDAAGHYTETLDAVLKHDSRRISKLISCVGYTSNAAVQVEAIRITQFFAARQPTLADMLAQQRPSTGMCMLAAFHKT